MRVMAGMSESVAGRICILGVMRGLDPRIHDEITTRQRLTNSRYCRSSWIAGSSPAMTTVQKQNAPAFGRGVAIFTEFGLAPIAHETQQEQEQVDEVEVEGQRAHHRLA